MYKPHATTNPYAAMPWYRHWAENAPDASAIVSAAGTITYGTLGQRIAQAEARLAEAGFAAGDRLLLEADPGSIDGLAAIVAGLNSGLQIVIPDQDWSKSQIPVHTAPLLDHCDPPGADIVAAELRYSPGIWLFTSGTTSRPKPRLRSLSLLHHDVARVASRLPATLHDRKPGGLCLLPLSHGFGLINALLLVHALGGTVYVASLDNRDEVATLLGDHRIEILYSWPYHLEVLADPGLWRRAAAPLAWCVSSSMRLSEDVARRFSRSSGCPVRQQYGATETGPLCLDSDELPSRRTNCVGRPLDGVHLRIAGPDGVDVGCDVEGMIAVKLEHLSLPCDELTGDGWWQTGDRGCRDPEGRIHVLGRDAPFTDERAPAHHGRAGDSQQH